MVSKTSFLRVSQTSEENMKNIGLTHCLSHIVPSDHAGSSNLTKHSIENLARSSAAAAAAASYSAAAAAASWGYFYPYGGSLVSPYGVAGLQAQNGCLPLSKFPPQPFQTLRY